MRTHKRTRCRECRREWAWRRVSPYTGPATHCPACGGQYLDVIEVKGFFDIDTPLDVSLGLPDTPASALTPMNPDTPLVLSLDPPKTLMPKGDG